jgi:uncharacterized protein (TIGR00255 family)
MIQSMTGYGLASHSSENYKVSVELKSLNSKFFELSLKLPRVYMKYEGRLRNELTRRLQRGKIMMALDVQVLNAAKRTLNINEVLVNKYMHELSQLSASLGLVEKPSLSLLLSLPEVIPTEIEQEDPEEWGLIEKAVMDAVELLDLSRIEEGNALSEDLNERLRIMEDALQRVREMAPKRLEVIRNRLEQSMEEIRSRIGDLDKNRFEQELIFYIERLDVNEEMVRLTQHITYFKELQSSDQSNGKQLSFLSQEMGREINTIGSKANDAAMQRLVVVMKDELEKIKEQINNIL